MSFIPPDIMGHRIYSSLVSGCSRDTCPAHPTIFSPKGPICSLAGKRIDIEAAPGVFPSWCPLMPVSKSLQDYL